jgi:hypothetical protein
MKWLYSSQHEHFSCEILVFYAQNFVKKLYVMDKSGYDFLIQCAEIGKEDIKYFKQWNHCRPVLSGHTLIYQNDRADVSISFTSRAIVIIPKTHVRNNPVCQYKRIGICMHEMKVCIYIAVHDRWPWMSLCIPHTLNPRFNRLIGGRGVRWCWLFIKLHSCFLWCQ